MDKSDSRANGFSLVFWMIVLGLLAIYAGGTELVYRWQALVFGARVCDVLIAASGVALLAAGVWKIATRAMRRASGMLAATGGASFAATLFIGVWTGAIPCSGSG